MAQRVQETYRAAVDGVDTFDCSSFNVDRFGKVGQQYVEVARRALVEQFADDMARTRSSSDHEDRFVPCRSESLRRVADVRLFCIAAERLRLLVLQRLKRTEI